MQQWGKLAAVAGIYMQNSILNPLLQVTQFLVLACKGPSSVLFSVFISIRVAAF